MDSSDIEEPERLVWPPRRLHMEFDNRNYKHEEDTAPEPPRRRIKVNCRANSFINPEAGMDGDGSGDNRTDDENDDLTGFIVANDVEFYNS